MKKIIGCCLKNFQCYFQDVSSSVRCSLSLISVISKRLGGITDKFHLLNHFFSYRIIPITYIPYIFFVSMADESRSLFDKCGSTEHIIERYRCFRVIVICRSMLRWQKNFEDSSDMGATWSNWILLT